MIEARVVSYRVKETPLVTEADLRCEQGEVVAIVGPNGAGKSTLLRMLAGDLTPSAGAVSLAGSPLAGAAVTELALVRSVFMGVVRADVPFTARGVVGFGRHPHRLDPENSAQRDADKVAEAMRLTETDHLAERVFATLSSGERTRVALARAIAQDTPIMLLDEPTTALDLGHAERTMAMVRALADAGKAIVVVLHDLNAAAAHADQIVLMSGSRVVASGSPSEVLKADLLSEVYRQRVRVVPHPTRTTPLVVTE